MTALGTLRLTRDVNGLRYRVVVDGIERGRIEAGEDLVCALEPGRHWVQVRVHWVGSPMFVFEVGAGQDIDMRAVRTSAVPWVFGRGAYLRLTATAA